MNQPQITDLFPEPSFDELQQALEEWMNPENADSDVDSEEEEAAPAAPAKSAASKPAATKVDSVADAFNDLFN